MPEACECNDEGSTVHHCNENGLCSCKENIVGDKCDSCMEGYSNFPDCNECDHGYYGLGGGGHSHEGHDHEHDVAGHDHDHEGEDHDHDHEGTCQGMYTANFYKT